LGPAGDRLDLLDGREQRPERRDWARPGTGSIYSTVVNNVQNGSIVLQHDGGGDRSQTLAALPREIDTLRARGYQFVTIPQLFGYKLLYK
jgi:peptidoglycan/xylan/chitin deacetylase (PgdA/CDA1 family)